MSTMGQDKRAETVSDKFIGWAYDAVDAWDGQDNGELLNQLAIHFGIPLFQLLDEGKAEMDRQAAEYAASVNGIDHT